MGYIQGGIYMNFSIFLKLRKYIGSAVSWFLPLITIKINVIWHSGSEIRSYSTIAIDPIVIARTPVGFIIITIYIF